MAQEKSMKRAPSEERKKPYNTLNRRKQYQTRTERKVATENKREQQQQQKH